MHTYQVNEADQIVKVTIPAASITETFEYDADGNLLKEKWVQSQVGQPSKMYTYDALGRRKDMTEGGLLAAAATTRYDYNSTGSLIATTLPEGEIDLTVYDARGLAVGQVRRHADATTSAMTTLKRDEDGRVLETFDGVNTRTTVAHVDGAGRPGPYLHAARSAGPGHVRQGRSRHGPRRRRTASGTTLKNAPYGLRTERTDRNPDRDDPGSVTAFLHGCGQSIRLRPG